MIKDCHLPVTNLICSSRYTVNALPILGRAFTKRLIRKISSKLQTSAEIMVLSQFLFKFRQLLRLLIPASVRFPSHKTTRQKTGENHLHNDVRRLHLFGPNKNFKNFFYIQILQPLYYNQKHVTMRNFVQFHFSLQFASKKAIHIHTSVIL